MTKKLSLLGKSMALMGTFLLWSGTSFGQGETCATAVAVPGSGTYTADGPSTGGGAVNNCFFSGGTNADWYSFTPPSDGTLDISSCADPGDIDSRLSVYSGGCGGLFCEDSNDDAGCNVSGYSSEITGLAVTGGTLYHIEWDDRWDNFGFDWDLTFTPAPLCTSPTATVTGTTVDCVAGTYTVTIDVTSIGDAPNVDITSTANGGVIPTGDDVGVGIYTTPAITLGTSTDIDVLHNGDPVCNISLGTELETAAGNCPVTSYPYCESFDGFTNASTTACSGDVTLQDGWSNPLAGADWSVDDFGTPSSSTGPSDDITGGGKYLFVETSGTSGLCEATAESPLFDIGALNAGNGAEVSLNYHMFGGTMGDFRVEIEDVTNSPGTYTTIFGPIVGDQGNQWNFTGWLDLSAVAGPEVRFRVVAFNMASYQSDMAFDEFCVREALPCTPPTATASTSTDCGAGTYTVTVDVTALGDATDVDITSTANGGLIPGGDDVGIGMYTTPAITIGTPTDIMVLHNGNPICDLDLGTFNSSFTEGGNICHAIGVYPVSSTIPTTDLQTCISFPGTQLGVDAFVSSVDLIISHTFNADLEVQLISPNNVTVDLVFDRFGSGDGLGDAGLCPGGLFTLQDGGAALTTTTTSNVVGTFNPEQPLTGFHDGSDPNGLWTLRVTDDAGGDDGDIRFANINIVSCEAPLASATPAPDCGSNQFFVDVDLTSLGSATDVDIVSDLNGIEFDDVSGLMVYSAGPFPSGSSPVITVEHNQDNACDIALGSFAFTCPPVNDVCGGAISIACNSITSASTAAATSGDNPGTCTTSLSTAPGVWYVIMGVDGEMTAALCGSSFDTKMGIFDGTAGCGSLVCIDGEDDDFGNGCGNDPFITWTGTAGTPYYIYVTGFGTNSGDFDLEVVCAPDPLPTPCVDNEITFELNTDDFGSETSWQIIPIGNTIPVLSGDGYASNAMIVETGCLFDGCYRLEVLDSFGDGMQVGNGSYVLRDENGNRIIDNPDPGNFGSVSALANNNGFCLPIGTDKLQFGSCDNEALVLTDFIIAEPNASVAAEFGGPNEVNSGFQFYLFNPNGGYSRRIFVSHDNPTQGAPPGATAVNHLRLSNIYTLPVPTDELLNVRVRGRVNGVYSAFGPACRIKVDPVAAACPATHLIDDVNNQFFSCGVSKVFGGSDKVYAKPIAGANKYQFRFENVSEGFVRQIAKPSYALILNWATLPLEAGFTYDVTVRASFDNGTTYCPFDKVCTVTITGVVPATGGVAARSIENSAPVASTMTVWPNPNTGEVMNVLMSDLPENEEIAQIMIIDTYGKTVQIASVPVIGGEVNAVVQLSSELATGMYIVQATAGSTQQFERIVIEK